MTHIVLILLTQEGTGMRQVDESHALVLTQPVGRRMTGQDSAWYLRVNHQFTYLLSK